MKIKHRLLRKYIDMWTIAGHWTPEDRDSLNVETMLYALQQINNLGYKTKFWSGLHAFYLEIEKNNKLICTCMTGLQFGF